jgi:hypothetical protein
MNKLRFIYYGGTIQIVIMRYSIGDPTSKEPGGLLYNSGLTLLLMWQMDANQSFTVMGFLTILTKIHILMI